MVRLLSQPPECNGAGAADPTGHEASEPTAADSIAPDAAGQGRRLNRPRRRRPPLPTQSPPTPQATAADSIAPDAAGHRCRLNRPRRRRPPLPTQSPPTPQATAADRTASFPRPDRSEKTTAGLVRQGSEIIRRFEILAGGILRSGSPQPAAEPAASVESSQTPSGIPQRWPIPHHSEDLATHALTRRRPWCRDAWVSCRDLTSRALMLPSWRLDRRIINSDGHEPRCRDRYRRCERVAVPCARVHGIAASGPLWMR